MDTFTIASLCVLLVLIALTGWWAIRAFRAQRWVSFSFALVLLLILGFGWNYFPLVVFLLLGPIFGWSFS